MADTQFLLGQTVSHYRIAASSADKPKARVAYQDFLSTWKDAEPDIPILKAAQAEYAKLQ